MATLQFVVALALRIHGSQTDTRAQQHQPVAIPMSGIRVANMELANGASKNEVVQKAAQL